MLFDKIKEFAGPKVGGLVLGFKRHQPEIYLAGGIVMGGTAAVMFAKAHKDADMELEPVRLEIAATKQMVKDENLAAVEDTNHEVISKVEEQKMLQPLYGQLVVRGAKVYGPSMLMGLGAVGLILASHGVMRGRNRALVSTVTLIERSFATYRQRVIEAEGKEADQRYYYGAEERNVVTLVEDEKGKTKKKRSKRNHIPEEPANLLYGRTFDNNNLRWQPDRSLNELFLYSTQDTMNWKLQTEGHVFLNTVYKELGFKETNIGAVSGWLKHSPKGDGFVSLGLEEDINLDQGDNRWMLDFNVQGNILDGVGNDPSPTW